MSEYVVLSEIEGLHVMTTWGDWSSEHGEVGWLAVLDGVLFVFTDMTACAGMAQRGSADDLEGVESEPGRVVNVAVVGDTEGDVERVEIIDEVTGEVVFSAGWHEDPSGDFKRRHETIARAKAGIVPVVDPSEVTYDDEPDEGVAVPVYWDLPGGGSWNPPSPRSAAEVAREQAYNAAWRDAYHQRLLKERGCIPNFVPFNPRRKHNR